MGAPLLTLLPLTVRAPGLQLEWLLHKPFTESKREEVAAALLLWVALAPLPPHLRPDLLRHGPLLRVAGVQGGPDGCEPRLLSLVPMRMVRRPVGSL